MTWEDIAIRLAAATAIGLALGFDRKMCGHETGLRTHALVALSSAMIVILAMMMFEAVKSTEAQAAISCAPSKAWRRPWAS